MITHILECSYTQPEFSHLFLQNLEAELCTLATCKDTALKELDVTFDKCTKILEFRKLQIAKNIFDQFNKKQDLLIKKGNRCISEKLCSAKPFGHFATLYLHRMSWITEYPTDHGKSHLIHDQYVNIQFSG